MDFHSMKRKALQALCKKHNLPANATNLEMANSLNSLLKVPQKLKPRAPSCLKGSGEIASGDSGDSLRDSEDVIRVSKKVRFLLQDEVPQLIDSNGKSSAEKKKAVSRGSRLKNEEVGSSDNVRQTRSVAGKSLDTGPSSPVKKKKGRKGPKSKIVGKTSSAVIVSDNDEENETKIDEEVGVVENIVSVTRSLRHREVLVVEKKLKLDTKGGNEAANPRKTRRATIESEKKDGAVGVVDVELSKNSTKNRSRKRRNDNANEVSGSESGKDVVEIGDLIKEEGKISSKSEMGLRRSKRNASQLEAFDEMLTKNDSRKRSKNRVAEEAIVPEIREENKRVSEYHEPVLRRSSRNSSKCEAGVSSDAKTEEVSGVSEVVTRDESAEKIIEAPKEFRPIITRNSQRGKGRKVCAEVSDVEKIVEPSKQSRQPISRNTRVGKGRKVPDKVVSTCEADSEIEEIIQAPKESTPLISRNTRGRKGREATDKTVSVCDEVSEINLKSTTSEDGEMAVVEILRPRRSRRNTSKGEAGFSTDEKAEQVSSTDIGHGDGYLEALVEGLEKPESFILRSSQRGKGKKVTGEGVSEVDSIVVENATEERKGPWRKPSKKKQTVLASKETVEKDRSSKEPNKRVQEALTLNSDTAESTEISKVDLEISNAEDVTVLNESSSTFTKIFAGEELYEVVEENKEGLQVKINESVEATGTHDVDTEATGTHDADMISQIDCYEPVGPVEIRDVGEMATNLVSSGTRVDFISPLHKSDDQEPALKVEDGEEVSEADGFLRMASHEVDHEELLENIESGDLGRLRAVVSENNDEKVIGENSISQTISEESDMTVFEEEDMNQTCKIVPTDGVSRVLECNSETGMEEFAPARNSENVLQTDCSETSQPGDAFVSVLESYDLEPVPKLLESVEDCRRIEEDSSSSRPIQLRGGRNCQEVADQKEVSEAADGFTQTITPELYQEDISEQNIGRSESKEEDTTKTAEEHGDLNELQEGEETVTGENGKFQNVSEEGGMKVSDEDDVHKIRYFVPEDLIDSYETCQNREVVMTANSEKIVEQAVEEEANSENGEADVDEKENEEDQVDQRNRESEISDHEEIAEPGSTQIVENLEVVMTAISEEIAEPGSTEIVEKLEAVMTAISEEIAEPRTVEIVEEEVGSENGEADETEKENEDQVDQRNRESKISDHEEIAESGSTEIVENLEAVMTAISEEIAEPRTVEIAEEEMGSENGEADEDEKENEEDQVDQRDSEFEISDSEEIVEQRNKSIGEEIGAKDGKAAVDEKEIQDPVDQSDCKFENSAKSIPTKSEESSEFEGITEVGCLGAEKSVYERTRTPSAGKLEKGIDQEELLLTLRPDNTESEEKDWSLEGSAGMEASRFMAEKISGANKNEPAAEEVQEDIGFSGTSKAFLEELEYRDHNESLEAELEYEEPEQNCEKEEGILDILEEEVGSEKWEAAADEKANKEVGSGNGEAAGDEKDYEEDRVGQRDCKFDISHSEEIGEQQTTGNMEEELSSEKSEAAADEKEITKEVGSKNGEAVEVEKENEEDKVGQRDCKFGIFDGKEIAAQGTTRMMEEELGSEISEVPADEKENMENLADLQDCKFEPGGSVFGGIDEVGRQGFVEDAEKAILETVIITGLEEGDWSLEGCAGTDASGSQKISGANITEPTGEEVQQVIDATRNSEYFLEDLEHKACEGGLEAEPATDEIEFNEHNESHLVEVDYVGYEDDTIERKDEEVAIEEMVAELSDENGSFADFTGMECSSKRALEVAETVETEASVEESKGVSDASRTTQPVKRELEDEEHESGILQGISEEATRKVSKGDVNKSHELFTQNCDVGTEGFASANEHTEPAESPEVDEIVRNLNTSRNTVDGLPSMHVYTDHEPGLNLFEMVDHFRMVEEESFSSLEIHRRFNMNCPEVKEQEEVSEADKFARTIADQFEHKEIFDKDVRKYRSGYGTESAEESGDLDESCESILEKFETDKEEMYVTGDISLDLKEISRTVDEEEPDQGCDGAEMKGSSGRIESSEVEVGSDNVEGGVDEKDNWEDTMDQQCGFVPVVQVTPSKPEECLEFQVPDGVGYQESLSTGKLEKDPDQNFSDVEKKGENEIREGQVDQQDGGYENFEKFNWLEPEECSEFQGPEGMGHQDCAPSNEEKPLNDQALSSGKLEKGLSKGDGDFTVVADNTEFYEKGFGVDPDVGDYAEKAICDTGMINGLEEEYCWFAEDHMGTKASSFKAEIAGENKMESAMVEFQDAAPKENEHKDREKSKEVTTERESIEESLEKFGSVYTLTVEEKNVETMEEKYNCMDREDAEEERENAEKLVGTLVIKGDEEASPRIKSKKYSQVGGIEEVGVGQSASKDAPMVEISSLLEEMQISTANARAKRLARVQTSTPLKSIERSKRQREAGNMKENTPLLKKAGPGTRTVEKSAASGGSRRPVEKSAASGGSRRRALENLHPIRWRH